MRIAILSDIHGNYTALREVLIDCKRLEVRKIIVLGDFVGYYYQADKVIESLSPWIECAIAGNHEILMKELLNNTRSLSEYEEIYGSGLITSIKNMRKAHIDYLLGLPENCKINIAGHKFFLCHGSPQDQKQYIYPDSPTEILNSCQVKDAEYVLLGHTHYPMLAKCGKNLLLNPGSVGQARDLGGLASWLLYDDQTGVFTFRRTPYPVDDLITEIKKHDPHIPKLWQILIRGQK